MRDCLTRGPLLLPPGASCTVPEGEAAAAPRNVGGAPRALPLPHCVTGGLPVRVGLR
jgi:hypothetical protein